MRTIVSLVVGLVLVTAAPAHASFHNWDFNEVYSSDDGSVQFIELFNASDFEQFTAGQTIASGSNSFSFPSNTPAPTGNHHLLLVTPGFADLDGGVEPDFEIPVNFFDPSGDTLVFAGTIDPSVTLSNLPIDGVNSLHYPVAHDFVNNGVPGQQFPERSLLACANVLATHDLRAGCSRCPKADLRDAGGGGSDCGAGGDVTLGGTGFAAIG